MGGNSQKRSEQFSNQKIIDTNSTILKLKMLLLVKLFTHKKRIDYSGYLKLQFSIWELDNSYSKPDYYTFIALNMRQVSKLFSIKSTKLNEIRGNLYTYQEKPLKNKPLKKLAWSILLYRKHSIPLDKVFEECNTIKSV
jgi:hypothetical protein